MKIDQYGSCDWEVGEEWYQHGKRMFSACAGYQANGNGQVLEKDETRKSVNIDTDWLLFMAGITRFKLNDE